jgi:hypothetical protein
MAEDPKLKVVKTEEADTSAEPVSIQKPGEFNLGKFKSSRAAAIAGVETLQVGLPILRIADAKDWVRLHPDEENYWSDELCFVNVPVKGQKRDTLHLIDETLAMRHLNSKKILRFRLALATKPHDVFFLCQVPSQNLDNSWNDSALRGCRSAMQLWTEVTSRKEEGFESYKITFSQHKDAFPDPKWPKQSLNELIMRTFADGRMIEDEHHPGLARLIGARQKIS